MKRYWIVAELFYPDETSTGFVMTKIAETVLELGEVQIICGPEHVNSLAYKANNQLDERIKIHRAVMPNWDKNNLLLRVLKSIIFTCAVAWKVIFKIRKGDTVILVTNPPTLIPIMGILKWLKGFKMFIILQDIFPENLGLIGIIDKKSVIYKLLLKIFTISYNKADHLIACGKDMKDVFTRKVRKDMPISVITNWADHLEIFNQSNFDRNKYYGIDISGKVLIQFAGNVGRMQGLEKFLALYHQANNDKFLFVIIGHGAFKDRLMKMQEEEGIKNVIFLPPKSRKEQNDFLNACDIGLVTLSPGMYGLGVPSKTYNILAAGKPILYIGDDHSEIYEYIKEYNVGWAFNWERPNEIVNFLANTKEGFDKEVKVKGQIARTLVENKFTRAYVLSAYKEVLS